MVKQFHENTIRWYLQTLSKDQIIDIFIRSLSDVEGERVADSMKHLKRGTVYTGKY